MDVVVVVVVVVVVKAPNIPRIWGFLVRVRYGFFYTVFMEI